MKPLLITLLAICLPIFVLTSMYGGIETIPLIVVTGEVSIIAICCLVLRYRQYIA